MKYRCSYPECNTKKDKYGKNGPKIDTCYYYKPSRFGLKYIVLFHTNQRKDEVATGSVIGSHNELNF